MGVLTLGQLPWWLKISAKVVLSQLPISYEQWRGVGLFKHGEMLDPRYAVSVFDRHFRFAAPLPEAFALLELGPGDSLATAVIAASHGAGRVYLVDAGRFASVEDVSSYNALAAHLASLGRPVRGAPFATVADMLAATNAHYLTEGVRSLASIPPQSIDFAFSQAVLEHVALGEFDATLTALYAIQKPGSICSHRVDLQDHLAHSLNSLRFSPQTWESRLFASAGFYTNRLRATQVLERFEKAGYQILSQDADRWPVVPLPPAKMHPMFSVMGEEELRVRSLDVVARRPG